MSPEIELLITLQRTDREIQRLKAEIAELPKRVAAIEEQLAGTKVTLEKAKSAVRPTTLRVENTIPLSPTCARKFPSTVINRSM